MSKPTPQPSPAPIIDPKDAFVQFLDSVARFLFWAGTVATLISLGFLIYTFQTFMSGGAGLNQDLALSNIGLFKNILLAGVLALSVGATFTFWGEEVLGFLQLLGAGALFFAPIYLPMVLAGGQTPTPVSAEALAAMQFAGGIFGLVAIAVTIIDIIQRIQLRSQQGARADQLKYGKGIKEEKDIQDVFMGKCWQLPFCRKFVRERCPIYHSRRTCWREQVGCMCEEQVIRDAMSGKVIPKDAVQAAKFIPINNKLTPSQKQERCRQCVIYNEHQKHKYKLILPVATAVFVGLYLLFRGPLLEMTSQLLVTIDRMIGRATFRSDANVAQQITDSGMHFQEVLLICLSLIVFTYVLKLVEFLIFKLKV
ncbi:MAG: hypothetical protein QY327_07415 [Fimbriimonadaceae bacterium]|uniref:Uncharacterized protein n=1 Tax=Candidatus Nitrosymbiomonas proteolyticus TaxID=2608984 RepID=A0A809R5V2_9BACT|nr:MAG: hypothetical protein EDM74_02325 [Armatimonadota bacterium]KXK18156.1 MAG: hypothetical protein UZ18_ATM001000917 [Armatimonadetes bacterium OLB18]MBV6491287.1 hypothetical protein [Fimbriimonadaceae bacterium]QOJ11410.1 MAG: hypothetical protein HRU74_04860 [Chthonomonadaceae bacterium]BBO22953.1 conserved hypothetical protein [Candidatus Nitrosymbiomonas proteolyticus]